MRSNNQAIVEGEIISELIFNHEISGEKFYLVDLRVNGSKDNEDVIPLMVSEGLVDVHQSYTGMRVKVEGQLHSYQEENRLKNYLLVGEWNVSEMKGEMQNRNQIYLEGYICKVPIYETKSQEGGVTDVLLAVDREHGKSDYISCICFGQTAVVAGKLDVGDHVAVWGRIQSSRQTRVFVNKIECLE